jgi:small subunit ribosomal protein S1
VSSQEVDVIVLDIDMDKRRISLGIKQCMENPWTSFAEKFKEGTIIEGETKNATEFGLFIGLTDDIDGMIHLSDLSWTEAGEEAIKAYPKGTMVKAKILEIDIEKERVALGIKQLTENPNAGALDGIKKGEIVTCVVTAVSDNGVEVKVRDTLDGYIKKVDLARERHEQKPERFAIGEKVDAKIIAVEKGSNKLSLSVKAIEIDEDKQAMAQYGSSDSGASLGDILGAALEGAKKK